MSLFTVQAPRVMGDLEAAFGLTDFQAAGVVGSIGRECGGFSQLRELGPHGHPLPEGQGGYGWCQWTGSRARSFMLFSHQNHLDWQSYEANWGYLRYELVGEYHPVVVALRKCADLKEAVIEFEKHYERAGVVAMGDRLDWAERAMRASNGVG